MSTRAERMRFVDRMRREAAKDEPTRPMTPAAITWGTIAGPIFTRASSLSSVLKEKPVSKLSITSGAAFQILRPPNSASSST